MDSRERRAYTHRNRTLRLMGYPSYDAYLKSPLWGRIRTEQLVADSECYGCGNRACEVHHGSYSRAVLEGRTRKGLYSICSTCHRTIEFERGRGKLGPMEATSRLKRIREERTEGRKVRARRTKQREHREIRELRTIEAAWAGRYAHLMVDDDVAAG